MEKFQELREQAKKKLAAADHMLYMTYPVVDEPKLLLTILDNIYESMELALDALLQRERQFKLIPPYHNAFSAKLDVFKRRIAEKYSLNREYAAFLQTLRNLMVAHNESHVEFSKKDTFVICSDRYEIKTVSMGDLKSYLTKAKIFIQDIDKVLNRHEYLFE